MSLILADRVKETTITTGTGAVALLGAAAGFRAFGGVCADGDGVFYCIAAVTPGAWEVGRGTWNSAGNTLARDAVTASSNAGAAVNFGAGTKDVFLAQPADMIDRLGILASSLPRVQRADFIVSEASLRTLFSAPLTLLPAVVGSTHQLVFSYWYREAGTAYTLNGSTLITLVRNAVNIDAFAPSVLFTGAGPYARMMLHDMQNGGGGPYGADAIASPARDDTNKALTLTATVANWTGGSGRLFLSIFYREWPLAQLPNFDGVTI